MSDPLVVDLFVEDLAHEVFVGALANRIAREEQVALSLQARSARGGHPRALQEFGTYEAPVEKCGWGLGVSASCEKIRSGGGCR